MITEEMKWAEFALNYMYDVCIKNDEQFQELLEEIKNYSGAKHENWYSSCKNVAYTLRDLSQEFPSDRTIPGSKYSSPNAVKIALEDYRNFSVEMRNDLKQHGEEYKEANKLDGYPYLISLTLKNIEHFISAIHYVESEEPSKSSLSVDRKVDDIIKVCRRFHESILSLEKHPHGGNLIKIKDEWDCQYIFRAILSALFDDIRDEEWNPSIAGSASRCEFFIKDLNLLIELKYVRKASDNNKIKNEISRDLTDYGGNTLVNKAIFLVYDPLQVLRSSASLQKDMSGATKGLDFVKVIVSPPRDI